MHLVLSNGGEDNCMSSPLGGDVTEGWVNRAESVEWGEEVSDKLFNRTSMCATTYKVLLSPDQLNSLRSMARTLECL